MANRDFNAWLSTMKDSVATWTYYTDFNKVYENVQKIKVELNILNSLIGSKNIEEEFKSIVNQYPNVLVNVPILLAKREAEIKVQDADGSYIFNFVKMNYTVDQYALFMRNSGLFDLLQNHIINNLVDYVLGIEVGMDTNGRKNRTGHVMEDLVESYLIKAGLVKGKTYFKEMNASEVERRFHLDLSSLSNDGELEKRFDFVFVGALGTVFACECNFYGSSGSKLNETAGRYKLLTLESKNITGLQFVWFTDGVGWNSAKKNLKETFDVLDNLYNLKDLEDGAIAHLIDSTSYLKKLLESK
ncbi:MAG: type II restriction endonuclease [Erysipelotrichaceae bacterium]|nr:type II restriction endonuclease [Erysipelotrichaceae bacterium]